MATAQHATDSLARWRIAVVGALLAVAALAWWSTAVRMDGMDAGPGTDPGAIGFYISTWVVMMAAMMFPSTAPMIVTYASLQRGRAGSRGATWLFAAGYLFLWAAVGLFAYVLLELGRELDGGFFSWDGAGRWTAAGVLAVAAIYEFTPMKDACLRRCRAPLGFLTTEWRDGRGGALRMGLIHGAWCVGCCWALMAALFALGAMSIAWMVVIALLISVEKLLPWRPAAVTGVAVVLAALAIGVAAAPASVPGLTVPSSSGMPSMSHMEMDSQ
jgi:predicted metal-binding membrane protein